MKISKRRVAVLLCFVLVFSFILGQKPTEFRIAAAGEDSGDLAATGQVTSGGGITVDPTPVPDEATDSPEPTETPEPTENPYGLSAPVRDEDGVTTWDCINFGNYWQNDTNGDGTADKKDTKTPIRWRVLSVYENDAFLMADQGLDCQPYNTEDAKVTWETSSIRTWLNSTFYQEAFSLTEQEAVSTTKVETMEKNPENGANYKVSTQDKVYLLSITEVGNTAYGFDSDFAQESKSRCSKGTAYARGQGALISTLVSSDDYKGNVWWLLRSSTYEGYYHTVALVGGGGGSGYSSGCAVQDAYAAIRPVLHINLSTDTWSKAGYVKSDGESYDPTPTPAPTLAPTPTPSPADNGSSEKPTISQKPDPTVKPEATNTLPPTNTKLKDSTGVTYTVTKSDSSKGEVAYSVPKSKTLTSVTIPATVKIDNVTYKVTSIKASAFKNNKKLKKVTIGKNIKSIGKNAFYGCSNLKNITIKTTKLTKKQVGSKAFAKLHKKVKIKVPKKKLSAYKKLLKQKGVSGKNQIIKK